MKIGSHKIAIACDDPSGTKLLRFSLSDHLREAEFPLGFVLSKPNASQKYFVVKDRSGYVLGRSKRLTEAIAVLSGHLSAFLPEPPNSVRLNLRALVSRQGSVICFAWPLFFAPPVTERRLHKMGYSVMDTLAVDIDPTSGRLMQRSLPWPKLQSLDPGVGHVLPSANTLQIRSVMWATFPDAAPTTFGQGVAFLATCFASNLGRQARIELAEMFASQVEIVDVPLTDRGAVYRILQTRDC